MQKAALALTVIVAGTAYQWQQQQRMTAVLRAAHAASGILGHGRTAVVTGATSGIGRACAIRLAESGAMARWRGGACGTCCCMYGYSRRSTTAPRPVTRRLFRGCPWALPDARLRGPAGDEGCGWGAA